MSGWFSTKARPKSSINDSTPITDRLNRITLGSTNSERDAELRNRNTNTVQSNGNYSHYKEQNETLRKEILRLQMSVTDKDSELRTQKTYNQQSHADYLSCKTKNEELRKEVIRLQTAATDLKRDNDTCNHRLKLCKDELEDWKKEYIKMDEIIKTLHANVTGRDDVMGDIMQKNVQLTNQIEELKIENKRYLEESEKNSQYEQQINILRQNVNQLKERIKRRDTSISKLKEKENSRSTASVFSSEVADLQDEKNKLKATIEILSGQNSRYEQEVNNLQQEVKKLIDGMERQHLTIEGITEEKHKLLEVSANYQDIIAEFERKCKVQEEINNNSSRPNSIIVEDLKAENLQFQKYIEDLKKENNVLAVSSETYTRKIDELEFQIRELSSKRTSTYDARVESLQRENEKLQNTIEGLKRKYFELTKTSERDKRKIEALAEEVKYYSGAINSSNTESIEKEKKELIAKNNELLNNNNILIDEIECSKKLIYDLERVVECNGEGINIDDRNPKREGLKEAVDVIKKKIDQCVQSSENDKRKIDQLEAFITRLEEEKRASAIESNEWQEKAKQLFADNQQLQNINKDMMAKHNDLSKQYKQKVVDLETQVKEYEISRDFRNPRSPKFDLSFGESMNNGLNSLPVSRDSRHTFTSIKKDSNFSSLTFEQENDNLRRKNNKLQTALEDQDHEIKILREENSVLLADVESYKNLMYDQDRKLQEIEQNDKEVGMNDYIVELKSRSVENQKLKEGVNVMKNKIKQLMESSENDKMKIDHLEKEIHILQEEKNTSAARSTKNHMEAQEQFMKNKQLQTTINDQMNDIDKLRNEIKNNRIKFGDLEKEFQKNLSKVEENNTRLMNHGHEVKSLKDEIKKLKATIGEKDVVTNGLQEFIKNLERENEKLQKLTLTNGHRAKLSSLPAKPPSPRLYIEEEDSDFKRQVENLKKVIETKDEEILKKQNALMVMRDKIKTQQQEVNMNEYNRINHENMINGRKIRDFEVEVERLKAHNKDLTDELALLRRDNNSLQAEMDNMKRLNFKRNTALMISHDEENARPRSLQRNSGLEEICRVVPRWWQEHMTYDT